MTTQSDADWVGHAVVVTILGESSVSIEARIQEISGRRMLLATDTGLSVSQLVKVDSGETLWLGEVVAANATDDSVLEIKIAQVLFDLPELARIRERFLGSGKESRASRSDAAEPAVLRNY